MKNTEREQYIPIPIWFIKLTSNNKSPHYLTPFESQLYWLIRGLSNKSDCYASDEYFANIFNYSIKHINKSIHKLELLKMLYVNHKNHKRFIGASLIDKGSVFVYIQTKEYVKLTTENNVYEFSWDEWGKMNEDDERDWYSELK